MAFKDEVTKYVHDTFANSWTITDGRKIPTTDKWVDETFVKNYLARNGSK